MAGSIRQVGIEYVGKATGLIKATKQAEGQLDDFASTAEQSGDKAGSGFGAKMAAGLEKSRSSLDKASGVIGVGAAATFGGALAGAMDNQKAVSTVSAQLGLTQKQSKEIGSVAGHLYSQAYGENMGEVTDAVGAVRSSIKGMNTASAKDLEAASKNALNFAGAMKVDVGDAAVTAGTLVNTGLAKNATAAFDLMTAASQKAGPQMTEPILDATNEYSKHFAGLGFSGEQAMGVLSTAASGGEIAIDKAGDAIKEFQIRATDLGDTGAQSALKDLGLDGEKTANALLKGGKSAQTATGQIAKGLLSVKDPAKQAQLTTALFGTQAEDIGKDNMPAFLKSLTGAETGLGKVDGAAGRMGKSLNDNASTNIEQFKRQITQTFVDVVGAKVVPALTSFTGVLANNPTVTKVAIGVIGGLAAGLLILNGVLRVASTVQAGWALAQTIANKALVQNTAGALKNAAVWTGQKAAMLAASVAQKAVAAGQWLINAAMSANPIGIVVVALTLLVGGLILAYKKSETFRNIVNGAFNGIKAVAGSVVGWFTGTVVPFFTQKLPGAVGGAIGWVKKNWPTILAILTGPIGLAVLAVTKNWDKITGAFSKAKNWVTGTWKKGWSAVKGAVGGAVEGGKDKAAAALSTTRQKFSGLKTWTSGTWKKGWSGAKAWIGNAVEGGRDKVKTALSSARGKFSDMKSWTSTTWKKGWSGAKKWIHDPVGSAQTLISKTLGSKGARKAFTALDTWGKKTFGPKWQTMKDKLSKPIQDAKAYFSKIFKKGAKGGFLTLFGDMVKNAGTIFGKIKNVLVTPIKAAINAINKYLIKGGINWILTKLGVPKKSQVPWIPVPKFATGGRIRGPGGPRDDKVLIQASNNEFMQPADSVQHYGLDVMEGLRNKTIPKEALSAAKYGQYQRTGALDPRRSGGIGFAGGGLVSYGGGRFTERFAKVVMALSKAVPGFQMYQGGWNAGGVAASGGTHDKDAIDYGPATRQSETIGRSLGLAAWLRNAATGWTQTGAHVHAVGSPSNSDGSSGARAQWQNYLDGENGLTNHGRDTGTRKYVGKGGLGGLIGGAISFLKGLSPVEWLLKKASGMVGKDVGGGAFGAGLMSKIPALIINKAKDWIAEKIGGGESSWTGGGVAGWNGSQLNNAATIVSVAKGLGFGQRGAQIGLMTAMQESTLNNLSGGDRDSVGLFQQRAPWGPFSARHNPAQAARMFYLGGQGGQPGLKSKDWRHLGLGQAAQAVQVSGFPGAYDKWAGKASALVAKSFDTGGRLPQGLSLVHNGTGREELVLNPQQERAATATVQHSAPTIINIHVDGSMNDDRTIGNLIRAIEQYQRRRGPVKLVRKASR